MSTQHVSRLPAGIGTPPKLQPPEREDYAPGQDAEGLDPQLLLRSVRGEMSKGSLHPDDIQIDRRREYQDQAIEAGRVDNPTPNLAPPLAQEDDGIYGRLLGSGLPPASLGAPRSGSRIVRGE